MKIINGKCLTAVKKVKYLGQITTNDGDEMPDIIDKVVSIWKHVWHEN